VDSIATPGSSIVQVSGVSEESAVALLDADCFRETVDVFDGNRPWRLRSCGRKLDPTTRRPTNEIAVHGSVEDRTH
jgi:hypothetical protein